MFEAIKMAKSAAARDEVPVGAVLVGPDGQALRARAMNRKEEWTTPLGHAEIIALHRAAKKQKAWRLEGCTLYVTLEPCLMCAGAILQARLGRLVFGATDPKAGAAESLYKVFQDSRLNHQVEVTAGVLAKECGQLLSDFFKLKRAKKKK